MDRSSCAALLGGAAFLVLVAKTRCRRATVIDVVRAMMSTAGAFAALEGACWVLARSRQDGQDGHISLLVIIGAFVVLIEASTPFIFLFHRRRSRWRRRVACPRRRKRSK